jgi:hypothetical protein
MLSEQDTCRKQSHRSHRHGERFHEIVLFAVPFAAALSDKNALSATKRVTSQ